MSSVRLAVLAALVGCAALSAGAVQAQVFRIVGPDGRVTFSDRPPADGKATAAQAVPIASATGSNLALPTEVRNAATRFPITLYTGTDCGPCIAARSYLTSRGVPFTERTVSSNEDIQALGRLMGDSPRVPFATIGSQHVRGFSEVEWAQYLDAAGYPKTSQLPPGYRNPAATPLVALQPAPAPRTAATPQQPPQSADAAPGAPSEPAPSNPAGIRF
jgi:glutaredoxin